MPIGIRLEGCIPCFGRLLSSMYISVIIPTYRPGTYISECLKSILNQTLNHEKYEILVILNGDKEPYYSHLSQYHNIRLFYSEISGVSNARNIGIDKAKGEYICFIDDDDIVSPRYLELLLAKADEDTLVVSNVYSFIYNIEERRSNFFICKYLKNKENITPRTLFENRSYLAFPVAKMIHKSIIGKRRFDGRFKNGEDALFITSISDKIKRIVYAGDDSIYYVRERIGSASRKSIPKRKLLADAIKLIITYWSIYIKSPMSYNFPLFLSRIPGVLKNVYILSKNK